MLCLENIVAGVELRGLAGSTIVEIVRTEWVGSDALNVVYRGADGPAEVLLFRDAEPRLELIQATRAFSFDGDGETFRTEVQRKHHDAVLGIGTKSKSATWSRKRRRG